MQPVPDDRPSPVKPGLQTQLAFVKGGGLSVQVALPSQGLGFAAQALISVESKHKAGQSPTLSLLVDWVEAEENQALHKSSSLGNVCVIAARKKSCPTANEFLVASPVQPPGSPLPMKPSLQMQVAPVDGGALSVQVALPSQGAGSAAQASTLSETAAAAAAGTQQCCFEGPTSVAQPLLSFPACACMWLSMIQPGASVQQHLLGQT